VLAPPLLRDYRDRVKPGAAVRICAIAERSNHL
jgi:hypothetical protein